MSPIAAFLLLLAALVAWAAIPFIPAIIELYRPRDAAPLSGVGSDAGDLTWFATGFRRYAHRAGLFDALTRLTERSRVDAPGTDASRAEAQLVPAHVEPADQFPLQDGTNVRTLRTARSVRELAQISGRPQAGDRAPEELRDIIVIDVASRLPDHLVLDGEVYARSVFLGGDNLRVRALLGESDVHLAAGSTVVRWIHAEGVLHVAAGSSLFGRATSTREMRLAPGVQFERIMAPRIIIGGGHDEILPPLEHLLVGTGRDDVQQAAQRPASRAESWRPADAQRLTRMSADTIRMEGDLLVPAGAVIRDNLVVIGELVLERGSQVYGSVKARRSMRLDGENFIAGSLTSREDVHIGERSRVQGPVIGEGTVRVGASSAVGSEQAPTTVAAARVELGQGATVYGAIAARERGQS